MRADGMTFRPRRISDPVVTKDLGGKERTVDGPHRDEVGVETMTVLATRGLSESLLPPVLTVVLNNLAEQRKQRKHVHRPPLPVLRQSIHRQCLWLWNRRHELKKAGV